MVTLHTGLITLRDTIVFTRKFSMVTGFLKASNYSCFYISEGKQGKLDFFKNYIANNILT